MKSIADLLVVVYCLVDDLYTLLNVEHRLRTRGFPPKLRDSEVITLLLVGEFLSLDQEKALWKYFRRHWMHYFPKLGSRSQFCKQSANLWRVTQQMQPLISRKLAAFHDSVHLVDGVPIPICTLGRKSRVKRFKGTTAKSYCAAKKTFYFGFKGHVLTTMDGVITSFTLTPANSDEREAVWDLVDGVKDWLLGDKGYIGEYFKEELRAEKIQLEVPHRKNMQATRSKVFLRKAQQIRRRIETVISQLTERFHINRTYARDLWHLTARISRKLLAHTLFCFINFLNGRDLLHFDDLIKD